jgi:putative ABC transport system permease protein
MIKNYILISFRNLRKHLSYSLINIFGLGLGLATCLLLITWILHELSYDRFNTNAERIYRGSLEYAFGGQVARTPVSPNALLPALLSLPEVQTGVRVYNAANSNPYIVKYADKLFQESKFYVADSTFFKVFSYKLLQGNPDKVLAEPYSVIITEKMAKKYFGEEDPIGKNLYINNKQDYLVTGVLANPPSNSLMQFDFIAPFQSIRAGQSELTWWSANFQTFALLHPNADIKSVETKINEIVHKAVGQGLTGSNDYVRYNFMKLTDIYLRSDIDGEPEVTSDIRYIYIFAAVTLLILVIACINYINLATARATDRAKEVGIRKVVGALRNQLFMQFIGESIVITFFAFLFAYFVAQTMLPIFNEMTGKHFSGSLMMQPSFLLASFVGLVVIAVLSGAYPALAITSFKPVSVLKGNFKSSGRGIWLRKSLVILQFGISVVLITTTLIIIKQLNFIQAKKLGYDKENTIILPLDAKTREVYEALRTELIRTGSAAQVSRGSESPTSIKGGYTINRDEGSNQPGIVTTGLLVDEDYLPTLGIEIIKGRNFTKEDRERLEKDTVYSFIINEAAQAALFLNDDEVIGKRVSMGRRRGEIIGLVKNFHFASLHTNINPLTIFPEDQFSKVFIKMPAGNVKVNLEKIQETYSTIVAHRPFEYQFLDQQYAGLYTAETRMSAIFVVFATLAIIIACLGLLGLVSFSAAQKTKEIGIRKVMGATAANIVILISQDFTKLVVIAIALGIPVSYWMMSKWLHDFAYKTEIGVGPVLISSLICIVIALGTAGYQAVKAALIDPAKTLRSE